MLDHNSLKKVKLLAMEVDGVLTDGRTWQNSMGVWQRNFSVRDSLGLKALRRSGYEVLLLASFSDASVEAQFRALDVLNFARNCQNKTVVLETFLRNENLAWDECAYITQDTNDLDLIKKVGISATVSNASSVIQNAVQIVSVKEGGDGAVRDVCSLIADGGFYSAFLQLKKAINI